MCINLIYLNYFQWLMSILSGEMKFGCIQVLVHVYGVYFIFHGISTQKYFIVEAFCCLDIINNAGDELFVKIWPMMYKLQAETYIFL